MSVRLKPRLQAYVGTDIRRGLFRRAYDYATGQRFSTRESSYSTRTYAQGFRNAILTGDYSRANSILKDLRTTGDAGTITQFFTTDASHLMDRSTVRCASQAIQSENNELVAYTKFIVEDYLRANDGVLNSITPSHLDPNITKKIVFGLLELGALKEPEKKAIKLKEIEREAGVSLLDEDTLRKFADRSISDGTSQVELNYASVIMRLKSIKNPLLNMIYNLAMNTPTESDSNFERLFSRKDESSPFTGQSGREITAGLLEQYFRKNGMSDRSGVIRENTALDWSVIPMMGRTFNAVKIDISSDEDMATRLGLTEDFKFSFPSFLKDIANGDIMKGFDAFWKAYTSLEIDRERIQAGTHPLLSHAADNQALKNSFEATIAQQQAYMLEILHSPSILGMEAYDAIHTELEGNKELRLFSLGYIEKLKEISKNGNHQIIFHALSESFKANTSWSKLFPFQVPDSDNGPTAYRPCRDYADACEWLNRHSEAIRNESFDLANAIFSQITGSRNVLSSNDPSLGFSDQTLWNAFNRDCLSELNDLREEFNTEYKRYSGQLEEFDKYIEKIKDGIGNFVKDNNGSLEIHTPFFSDSSGSSILNSAEQDQIIKVYRALYSITDRRDEMTLEVNSQNWDNNRIKNSDAHITTLKAIKDKLKACTSPSDYLSETIYNIDELISCLSTGLDYDPATINNPLDNLTNRFNLVVDSVLTKPEFSSIASGKDKYFKDVALDLDTSKIRSASSLFGACMQEFLSKLKKHYDEVGGELEKYLKTGRQIQAVADLMQESVHSSRLSKGERILCNVMRADDIKYQIFTDNSENSRIPENVGLLYQGINAHIEVRDVVGHEELSHIVGIDTKVSLVHYLEWVKRALTLAGSDQEAQRDIMNFFYDKALGGVILSAQRVDARTLLNALNNHLEKYETDPAAMKSKMGLIYGRARAAILGSRRDESTQGIYKLLQMTDARTHVSTQMSARYEQVEQQVAQNSEYNMTNFYGDEVFTRLSNNGTMAADLKGIAKIRQEVTEALTKTDGTSLQTARRILAQNFGNAIADIYIPNSSNADFHPAFELLFEDKRDSSSFTEFMRMIKALIQSFLETTGN